MTETAAASRRRGVAARERALLRDAGVARAIVALAAAAAGVELVVGAANEVTLETGFLNPDEEGSLFQLVTAVATLAGGAAAAFHAWSLPFRRGRFATLAAVLVYFALDDLLVIHEPLGEWFGETFLGLPDHVAVRLWILGLAPLLLTALVLVAQEGLRVGRPLGRVLLGGLAALGAAVAVEVVGVVTRAPEFIERVSGKPETLRYLVEEGLELGGWILIAGGLVAVAALDLDARRR